MEIKWFGQSCFSIKSKNKVIITDPFSEEIGIKLPKNLKAHIILISHFHKDHDNYKAIKGFEEEPFIISEPGEYEVSGIQIEGIFSFHDKKKGKDQGTNTIYKIELEDLVIVHLGDLGTVLNEDQLENLNGVDILFVPVGGEVTLAPSEAVEVINQLEPKIVIPMHYQIEKLKMKLKDLSVFLKEIGLNPRRERSLKISKTDLPEEMELVVLEKV